MKLKSKTFIFITLLLLSSCARIENRRDVASTAEVQSSCSEITKQFLKRSNHKSNLQNLKSSLLQINVDDYKTKKIFEEVEDHFKRTIAKIKNVDELFDIFDFLKVISSVKRVDQGKVHLFASKIQYLISQGNLKTKVQELAPSLSDSDKISILKILRETDNRIKLIAKENQRNTKSLTIQGHIKDIELLFSPESYKYFIDQVINLSMADSVHSVDVILASNYSRFVETPEVYIGKDIFSIETANIVDSLPDNIKEKAQAYILKKYHYFEELKNKDMRRNMEFLTRAFLQKDYRDLKNSISNANYVSKINSLFKQVNPKVTYNFQTVLDLTKTIQEDLVQTTLKSNESLYIYGSLPNGKANLSISDIDIHFHSDANKRNKDSLMEWQILANDPELKEFRNEFELEKIRERGQSNLENFIATEDKLAVLIGREEFERGSLLGSIADDSDFFSPTNLGVYNSILLEVFNNKIRIHIIDIFSKDKVITTLDI